MPLDTFEQDAAADMIVQEDGCVASPMAIPVYIDGPVETRELASRFSVMRSFTAPRNVSTTNQGVKIAGHDPRRRVIRISAYDPTGSCLLVELAGTNNEVLGAYAYQLPLVKVGTTSKSDVIMFTGTGEIWAVADPNGSALVSVVSESWI